MDFPLPCMVTKGIWVLKPDDSHHPAEDDSIWDFLNMAWPSNPVVEHHFAQNTWPISQLYTKFSDKSMLIGELMDYFQMQETRL